MDAIEQTQEQQDRATRLRQLDAAEHAKASFRQQGNWQRYVEMCQECSRLGRLLMLGEQEKPKDHSDGDYSYLCGNPYCRCSD